METILIHACCGPCSTVAVPWFRAAGLEPLAFFANPNIQPPDEHARRLDAMRRFADAVDLELVVEPTAGLREWAAGPGRTAARPGPAAGWCDPRERCRECLEVRLAEAAQAAAERGLGRFSTTLTVSPWQHHDLIARAGHAAAEAAGVEFVYADLRRFYPRSIDESRRLELYRQRYCGCVAGKWQAWHERRARRATRRRPTA
jgi:predicted adenine nucleotide alpha hydrolase (AANH) superfamily ATPase